jgi:3-oxoacyl-[acyl-carrier protein] reductase
VTLIFGGTYGIGAAIAKEYAKHGSHIAISARNESADTMAALAGAGVKSQFYPGDVGDWGDVKGVVDQAHADFGGLDTVIVSAKAGGVSARLFLDTNPEEFIKYFQGRTVSRFLVARAAADVMKERGGGSIIFLTTDAGRVPTPAESLLGASAAAVIFGTRAIGRELSRFKIRVNTISLTLTRGTPVYERYLREREDGSVIWRAFDKIEAASPLGLNDPEDVAALALFLGSDASRRITGATISSNGGLSFPG